MFSNHTRAVVGLGCLLLAGIVLLVNSTVPGKGTVVGSQGLFGLLGLESSLTVYESYRNEDDDQLPILGQIKTTKGGKGPGEPLPCLKLRPPCDFSYSLPHLPEGAQLEYALGVQHSAYNGRGRVQWVISLDGTVLEEVYLDCSSTVPRESKRWQYRTLALPHSGELRFRVAYEGDAVRHPMVGLGMPRVAMPFEVERQASTPAAPNIVLVVVDTMRADALGCLGNPRDTSPCIDKLAREGALFERAYSSAPWTLPGTASVLTGRSVPEHGVGDSGSLTLSEGMDTLATVLQRSGFSTAGFSCNPLIDQTHNFHRGFEIFETFETLPDWPTISKVESAVVDFLSGVGDQRFFLYLQPIDPHMPSLPLDPHLEHLNIGAVGDVYRDMDGKVMLPKKLLNDWYGRGANKPRPAGLPATMDQARLLRTIDRYRDEYDAETAEVDRFIAVLVARLEQEGLAEKTLICITADHGEEFLEHGLVGHFNQLYSESVHVPLILWGPDVPGGLRAGTAIENRHVAPTLLRTAGIDLPASMAGPNLLSSEDRAALAEEGVFLHSEKGRRGNFEARDDKNLKSLTSLIYGDWQLIVSHLTEEDGSGKAVETNEDEVKFGPGDIQLFNLADDPGALTDLAALNPKIVEDMIERIDSWQKDGRAARPELLPRSPENEDQLKGIGYKRP